MKDKFADDYFEEFNEDQFSDFTSAIDDMEAHSQYHVGIDTSSLRLTPADEPMMIPAVHWSGSSDLDPEILMDTMSRSKLIIHETMSDMSVRRWCVRDCAWDTLKHAAKLDGSALTRMTTSRQADTLNNGFEVARGGSILLERYGKMSAVHSDSYAVMPISKLINSVKTGAETEFGSVEFRHGFNSHSKTVCLFTLPDARNDILSSYAKALSGQVDASDVYDLTPGIRFESSDTQDASAKAIPVFLRKGGVEIRFVDGVRVKHEKIKGSESSPVERFTQDVAHMYPLFENVYEKAAELASIAINNPENCVVSLCNRYQISKKYGQVARDDIEELKNALAAQGRKVSAYDVYTTMYICLEAAESMSATPKTMNTLEDAIARILTCNWSEHDTSGNVSWKG